MKPQVEAWYHGVKVLAKIARRQPQLAYTGLGMSLQSEWKYLQRTVPKVGTLIGPIEKALSDIFFPLLSGGEKITDNFWKTLGHSVKHGGLGIPDPRMSEECA